MHDDPLTAALRAAAPVTDGAIPGEVGDALGMVARAVTAAPARAPRRSRRRMWGLALVGAALAVPTALGGGYLLSAHTGIFGAPGGTENDTSEWLSATAPDFPRVVGQVIPALPVPTGYDRDAWVRWYSRTTGASGDGAGVIVQVTGVQASYSYSVRCAWMRAWVSRQAAGDTAGTAAALRAMDDSLGWRALVATDGGGVIASMRRVNTAAHRGQVAAVRRESALNCPAAGAGAVR